VCAAILTALLLAGCATMKGGSAKDENHTEVGPVQVEVQGSTRMRAGAYRW
jgi:outer membrane murein-binding lipoprotein Lpp